MTRRLSVLAAFVLTLSGVAVAQEPAFQMPPPVTPEVKVTLAEALQQAKANSPDYRQALAAADPAAVGVRNAYGLLAPTVSVGAGAGYTGTGTATFGGSLTNQTPSVYTSSYQFTAQYQLSGRTINAPGQAKATERATGEDIANAEVVLRSAVTTQYLTALEQTRLVGVQRQQVARNEEFLKLAQARYDVGQGTLIDVRQAQVQLGQAQVAFLRAAQAAIDARLELFRLMGVTPPVAVEKIELEDPYEVVAPAFRKEELIALAAESNPALRAELERKQATKYATRQARSEYLPTLNARADLAGFTQEFSNEAVLIEGTYASSAAQAANCTFENQVRAGLNLGGLTPGCNARAGLTPDGTALLPEVQRRLIDQNNVWPFSFTRQPFQLSVFLSLPIFDGFSRNLRVSQARANEQRQDEAARRQALQVRANVERRFYQIDIAYRAIGVQVLSRQAAAEQLRLAQERYRVGSGTALDIVDAQNAVQRAEGDYLTAVYSYHRAITALEEAVGRPLR